MLGSHADDLDDSAQGRKVMRGKSWQAWWAWVVVLAAGTGLGSAGEENGFARREDVIYGRKDGMALTLDVLTPKKPNRAAVVWVVSGGWYSSHDAIRPAFVAELLRRGYTVFAVVHGSQPRYTIPEAVADMNRAVRSIRFRAKEFEIDPEWIGVTGASAGGHLSLMLGVAGVAAQARVGESRDEKNAEDRTSSRVQAVACFFPPTDFLNYGKEGNVALGTGVLKDFRAPFEFREFDPKTKTLAVITDPERVLAIGRQISPVYHVSADDAPTLIIHGDADQLVPIQQAQAIIRRLEENKVPAKLVTKPGAAHGWPDLPNDMKLIADWFDEHLRHVEKR